MAGRPRKARIKKVGGGEPPKTEVTQTAVHIDPIEVIETLLAKAKAPGRKVSPLYTNGYKQALKDVHRILTGG